MRKFRLLLMFVLLWLALIQPFALPVSQYQVVIASTEFSRTFSLTGASGQRLSTILAAAGYTGAVSVDELTIYNPAVATVYVGKSDVDASNGFPIASGAAYTWRRAFIPIDISQFWLFSAVTQNVSITVRGS